MKLHKKTPSAIAATFLIPQTTHNSYIFLTCLQRIKELIHNFLKETVNCRLYDRQLLSTQHRQSLFMKLGCVFKLLKYILTYTKNKIGSNRCNAELLNNQVQLTDPYHQKQGAKTTSRTPKDRDWMPLIKANTPNHLPYENIQLNQYSHTNVFAGQFILFVGGRAALYPEYRRLIALLGGSLLIYRGGLDNNINRLYTMLENADMIICPVDCVNHNDFYAVKFYCKFSGKPYTLLDRSNLVSFNKGVHTLAKLACQYKCSPNSYNQAVSVCQS